MNKPIVDFVEQYSSKKPIRLHMPGHKGKKIIGPESKDITEIYGADVLYSPSGIIKESQENAARIFDTAKTLYSCEGSTLCIKAMLHLVQMCKEKDKGQRVLILACRNVHKAFLDAVILLDLDVEWIYPDDIKDGIISCRISPHNLEKKLSQMENKPDALYITSPDYLGQMQDIESLSEVCHKYGVLLICDNAHGAYLNFLENNLHPIYKGADICCDSAHKTLPVLTGGAYLHLSKKLSKNYLGNAEKAMSLFASTSPSYLILQSLDNMNVLLDSDYMAELKEAVLRTERLKKHLKESGWSLVGDEPLKITIKTKEYGYYGYEIASYLRDNNIECEFADLDYVVLIFSTELPKKDYDVVMAVFEKLLKKSKINQIPPAFTKGIKRMGIREAYFSKSEEINVSKSLGRIFANSIVSCPPAVPVVICGEEITKECIQLFKYYGINKCQVLVEGE